MDGPGVRVTVTRLCRERASPSVSNPEPRFEVEQGTMAVTDCTAVFEPSGVLGSRVKRVAGRRLAREPALLFQGRFGAGVNGQVGIQPAEKADIHDQRMRWWRSNAL